MCFGFTLIRNKKYNAVVQKYRGVVQQQGKAMTDFLGADFSAFDASSHKKVAAV